MSGLYESLRRRAILPGRLGRYVLAEFMRSLGLAAGVFVGFFLLMTSLRLEGEAESHGTNVSTMLRTLPYFVPYLLLFAIPMAFLVAGVLAMGKLEGSGEISGMRAAGCRLTTVLAPPLLIALATGAVMLFLADSGIEWGFSRAGEIVVASGRAELLHRADTGKTLSIDSGERSYRIHRFGRGPDGNHPIAIVEFAAGSPRELVLARDHDLAIGAKTDAEGTEFDVLRFELAGAELGPDRKGWARVFSPGEVLLADRGELALAFQSSTSGSRPLSTREWFRGLSENVRAARAIRAGLAGTERMQLERAAQWGGAIMAGGAPSAESARRLERAEKQYHGSVKSVETSLSRLRHHEMEIHRKLSMALSPLAMTLLGLPLGLRLGRGGRVAGFTVGIAAIAVIFYPLWMSGQGLAVSGLLPPAPAVWTAPALVGTGGAIWLSKLV